MVEEIKRTPLPEGFTLKKKDEQKRSPLPEGFKLKKKSETATQRDEEKLIKEAGAYQVEEKTPEELKKMSIGERRQYIEDMKTQREFLQSSQFSKGALSGATFGLTENVDALKPIEFEETNPYSIIGTGGQVTGSLIPLSGLTKVVSGPAMKLAAKSPVFQKQISSLITMFGVGSADKALHEIAKGEMPSTEDVLENGVAWAALDVALQTIGAGGRFAKALFTRSKATGASRTNLVNRVNKELAESGIDMSNAEAVSQKALEILESPLSEQELAAAKRQLRLPQKEASQVEEVSNKAIKQESITPKDLKTRKISDEPVNKLTSETRTLSEPYQPEGIDFTKEAESLEKDAIQEKIDSVGERAATEEELGTAIKEDIETQLEARKEEYRPLYEEAQQAAQITHHTPQNTAREAGNRLMRISRLSTRPEGYTAVIKNLENVLEDAGFVIQRGPNGEIEQIISSRDVPVSDTIELARRLNEIIDYEAVEPTVKDALRGVARAAKQDVRIGLASNPDGLTAFNLAEEAHARTAQRFSTDNIRKIRGQEAGEKIAKMVESPSTLGQLKETLSPKQMAQVERELLEKLNTQNYEKSRKTLKEIERHMSAENRKLAREIVEAKNPHNPTARKKLTQESILNDMSNAFTTGTRPDKTLNLWKTPKGQKLVKETFHNSPNWPQVKNYLEKQSFSDMADSVLKDGKLDLKKYKSFMKDPATINNIRAQGGEEAVTFFKDLDSQVKQLQTNVTLLDKFPSKLDIKKGSELIQRNTREVQGERGKDILSKIKEKSESQPIKSIAKEKLGTKKDLGESARIAKESSGEKGNKILKRMAQKDFPMQAKVKKWREWFTDTMGLNEKGVMSVFGLMKLGIPNTVSTLLGYRMFNKLLTSPRVRRAFTAAAKPQGSSLNFIIAMENLGDELSE